MPISCLSRWEAARLRPQSNQRDETHAAEDTSECGLQRGKAQSPEEAPSFFIATTPSARCIWVVQQWVCPQPQPSVEGLEDSLGAIGLSSTLEA